HILLTGGRGQVGLALQHAAWPENVVFHAPGRDALDIADAGAIDRMLGSAPFAAVLNAAAYTAVDKAETDASNAIRCNTLAPALLAEASARAGVPLLHLSTDYVFDGRADRPYVETDPTNPLGVYGHSKRAGESAVLAANPRALVIRTAWVISEYRSNFLKTMLRLAEDRDIVSVVDDQSGRPTCAGDLANALITLITRVANDPSAPHGLYHLANAGETTWADLAEYIFECSSRNGGAFATVQRIPTHLYPTPAARPMNSRLDCRKIEDDFGIKMRPWQAAVSDVVAGLNNGAGG
ncbi:MAG: dTDP-4-dehydrorhamnose reductase, partial [Zymomonas sp.]